MTIGFLFGGQGSQIEGMGRDFEDRFDDVKALYKTAKEILGYDVLALTQTQLNQTEYAQPAIYTFGCAIQLLLKQHNITPFIVGGLSLGEYNALQCAQSISFEQGLKLLEKRATFMAEACALQETHMVAVLSDNRLLVDTLCQSINLDDGLVFPANYNAPGQIVVGGNSSGISQLKERLLEHGIKRVIPLKVSGAFHTPFMKQASTKLSPYLKQTTFMDPNCLVVGNTFAKAMAKDDIPMLLERQIISPVYFEDVIKEMIKLGVNQLVEIGPKSVLSQFVKKINKEVVVHTISTLEQLQDVIETFK